MGKITQYLNPMLNYIEERKNTQAQITQENYPRWMSSGLSPSGQGYPRKYYKEYIWPDQIGN